MARVEPAVFREYDIRGVAERDLNDDVVRDLGLALGTTFRRAGSDRAVVGRDARLSSPAYREALVDGLRAAGCGVVDVGMVPTPVFYHSIRTRGLAAGAMITGSHNPPEYNGFKVYLGESTLYGPEIQKLRRLIEAGDFEKGHGDLEQVEAVQPYLDDVAGRIRLDRHLRLVADVGNGTAGAVIGPLLERLGCRGEILFAEPDGRFPNHEADPTVDENLETMRARLREGGLDAGIAFDGDADRIGVLDEKGHVIRGDRLLILYARQLLDRRPGASVIFDVKCSEALPRAIEAAGGLPVMWKTGHSLIKKRMKEVGALLGGEMSGHMFFADGYYGFDDAFFAACRLLEILASSDLPLSRLLEDVPIYVNTPEIRVECPEESKFSIVEAVRRHFEGKGRIVDVDGVRVHFDEGWGLVRASNTQPVLVLRFEARDEEGLARVRDRMAEALSPHVDTAPLWKDVPTDA
jgi:phosphomannomutase/phosphoglucomutase